MIERKLCCDRGLRAMTWLIWDRNYLTEEEIRSVFNQFDRDGNGYLGASDVSKVYRSLGENLDDDLVLAVLCSNPLQF